MSCGNNCSGCDCNEPIAPKREEILTYFAGIAAGIQMYAWWKDGTQFVGTTGRTLAQALSDLANEQKLALEKWQHQNT